MKYYKRKHKIVGGGFYFCCKTKNNREVLIGNVKKRLEELLLKLCNAYKLPDVTIKIYPSHFHLFFGALLRIAPDYFAETVLKATNAKLKNEFGLDNLWNNDYQMQTLSNISKQNIEKFLEELENKLSIDSIK